MTKLEIEAIHHLPPKYIADGTMITMFGDPPVAFACNGNVPLPIVCYNPTTHRWRKVRFTGEQK